MTDSTFDQTIQLALSLSPEERRQLIAQVESSLEQDTTPQRASDEHWGQSLLKLVNELDMSDWTDIEIEDPVEWVRYVRTEQEMSRRRYWDLDE